MRGGKGARVEVVGNLKPSITSLSKLEARGSERGQGGAKGCKGRGGGEPKT